MKRTAIDSNTINGTWTVLLAVVVAALIGGGCTSSPCEEGTFSGSGTLYVAASCGSDSGDGSKESPLATIGAAIKNASAGDKIRVAAGTYEEALSLTSAVALLGEGSGKTVIKPSTGAIAIQAVKANLTVSGIGIVGGGPVGILVQDGEFDATDVLIEDVRRTKTPEGKLIGGHGIQVSNTAKATMRDIGVVGCSGAGVLAASVGNVSIVAPFFQEDPASSARAGGKAGIVAPFFDEAGSKKIAGNRLGGIAIVAPFFSPNPGKTDDPKGIVAPFFHSGGVNVSGNYSFGVALFGASAKIEASAITDTIHPTSTDFADGVVVAGGGANTEVAIAKSTVVSGNQRAGMLIAAGEKTDAKVGIDGDISLNAVGGVWAHGSSTAVAVGDSARLHANRVAGLVAVNKAHAVIGAATIDRTVRRQYGLTLGDASNIGDAVGFFEGATGSLKNTKLVENGRAGIVIDNPGKAKSGAVDVVATGVEVTGGGYGIVVNKGSGDVEALKDKTAVSVGGKVGTAFKTDAAFDVRHSPCDPKDGKADCKPPAPST